jgi:serine/threonine protein kinase
MDEPHQPVGAIFDAAIELPPAQRAAYLQEACAGDNALRQRVEALLCAHETAESFMESPVLGPRPEIPAVKPSEQPGDRIGRYKLLQQIGEGGCGVVYMAEQEEPVRRLVALKVIKLGMDTKSVIARFEAERQALALMDHPNIAKVLDAGATETGRPYFVMELVKAIPITRYCDENTLSTMARLGLFVQVCQAIQHAHQKGIIHRDIKPSNILVADHDGVPVPKIIDFGIAKATTGQRLTDKTLFTAFEQFIGTPTYMSPEQAKLSGLDIDTRTDIYSLGVLLYELLTGKTPFESKRLLEAGLDEVRRIIREEEPVTPSTRLHTLDAAEQTTVAKHRQSDPPKLLHLIRGDLDWIVMKCLEKDRARRYETANGLAMDIQRHVANEPVLARPPSAAYRLQKAWQRNKTSFAIATLMAVVLMGATGISVWQAVRAIRAETLGKQRLADSELNAALAKQRLAESEAISKFLIEVFQSPDPARDGRTITVAEALGAAAQKLDTDLATQPWLQAELQATLGTTYYALGLYNEAIPLQEKVRNYFLSVSGPEHPGTLNAMHVLANSYADAGRRPEALKLREQVLALRRKALGPEDPDTLRAMSNLANSYDEAGRGDEALKLQEEALALSSKVNGPAHADTLGVMNDLANSYVKAGRPAEALKLREQVLPLRRKVNGPQHPDTLKAIQNLADSYFGNGRRDEALQLREEALALYRKISGEEHPDTLAEMEDLALSYDAAGRRDEALKLREQVLALRPKISGPEHPDTIGAMHELAYSYEEAGRRDEALKLWEQVLALRRKVSGPEHPYTLGVMQLLANSYSEAGRQEEALKLREEGLALYLKIRGPEHPDTLVAMHNLANSYQAANRWEEALKLREQVLPLRRKVSGAEHPDTLMAMDNLAISYEAAGRQNQALLLREDLLALRSKANGPKDPNTIGAMNNLANSYSAAGRNREAVALLEKASEADPKDTIAWLRLASCQTWFGLDADYETTRRRVVQQAEGTDQASTAERAARVYCLRPSSDAALLAKALNLARRGVDLGKSDPMLSWYQIALGIAEYRNGQNAAAEGTLAAIEQNVGESEYLQGTARLFRALSLFRLDRTEEARRLLSQAEAHMPPLPKDPTKPIINGQPITHDNLIWWLAYKEAKALMEDPSALPSAAK